MLLQQIVALLDAELHRLEQLRGVVSGLARQKASTAVAEAMAMTEVTTTVEEAPAARQASRASRKPREARQAKPRRSAPAVPTPKSAPALSGPIPNAPVVVRREALADEQTRRAEKRQRPETPKEESPIGSLGAMIRALRPEASA